MVQVSHPYMTTGKTRALARWTFVGKVMSLLLNMLSRLVIRVKTLGYKFGGHKIHLGHWNKLASLLMSYLALDKLLHILDSQFQFGSLRSLSHVQLFVTPWIAAYQASLSIKNSQRSLKIMTIESVMPSSDLILCHPLLLLPRIPPSIRVFSNESTLHMRWPKYWSFSFSISPSNSQQFY